jgi:hypothetical protein
MGFKMASRIEGLDFDHALLAVTELATYHGLGWCYKSKCQVDKLSVVHPILIEKMFSDEFEVLFRDVFNGVITSFLQHVEQSLGEDSQIVARTKAFSQIDRAGLLQNYISLDGIDEDYVEGFLRVKPKKSPDHFKGTTLNNKNTN